MRIVQVSCSFLPNKIGGTEIYVYNLSKEMLSIGHKIYIVYIDSFFKKNAPLVITEEYVFEEIPVFVIKKNIYGQRTKDLYTCFSSKIYFLFKDYLKRIKPDIVHFHHLSSTDILSMMKATKELSIPLVLTYHTPQMSCGNAYMLYLKKLPCDGHLDYKKCLICILVSYGFPYVMVYLWANIPVFFSKGLSRIVSFFNLKGKLFTGLQLPYLNRERIERTKEALKLFDYFVVLCNWSLELLLKNGVSREKITLSRQGIERVILTTKKQKDDTLKLVYIGRIHHTKGIDILIRAFRQIPKDYRIKLYIYGELQDSSEEKYLKRLRKLASDAKRIEFKRKIDYKERFNILSQFDLLIIPSRWLETGPLVLLEAWSVGTPVIASQRGGLSELIREEKGGILYEPENFMQLRDIIIRIYKNPPLLERLKRTVPEFRTTKDVLNDMLNLYNKLLCQKKK
ncbi:MAG: glycosyltransferase [Candidatus Omnitrophica bacterium]|nr:glycosyltransferase [Candidatus Omnitrophota bacterium]